MTPTSQGRLLPAQRGLYRAQFGFVAELAEEAFKGGIKPAAKVTHKKVLRPVDRALQWYEKNVTARFFRPPFQRLEEEVAALPTPLEIPARIGLGIGGAAAGGLLGFAAAGPPGAVAGAAAGSTLAWGPASTKVWPYMIDPTTYVGFGVGGTPLRATARGAQLAQRASLAARGRAAFRMLASGAEPTVNEPVARALWKTAAVVDWPERTILTGTTRALQRVTAPAGRAGILPRSRESFAARVSHQGEAMMLDAIRARQRPVRADFLEGITAADRAALEPELRDLQPALRLIERVHGPEAIARLSELPSPQAAREVGTLLDSAARSSKWVQEPDTSWWKTSDDLWPELKESLSLPYFQRAWELTGTRIPFRLAERAGAVWQNLPPLKLINWVSRNALRFGLYPEANLVEGSLIQLVGDAKSVAPQFGDEIVRAYANHPAVRDLFRNSVPESMRQLAGRQELPSRRVVQGLSGFGQRSLDVIDPIRRNVTYANRLGREVFKTHFAKNWTEMLDQYGRRHGVTALQELLEHPAYDSGLGFRVMRAVADGPGAVAEAAGASDPLRAARTDMYERLVTEFPGLKPEVAAHLEAWKARGFQGTEGVVNVVRDAYQVAPVQETLLAPEMAEEALRAVAEGVQNAQTAADIERWRTLYEVASGLKMTAERRMAQGVHGWAAALPLEEQEAALLKYEQAAEEMGAGMDEAFAAATEALRTRGEEAGVPWARAYADVSAEISAQAKDARGRVKEALQQVLKVPRRRRTQEVWGQFYQQRDAIWSPVTRRMAELHMSRWDAQLRTALEATKAAPSDASVVQVMDEIVSGRFGSRLDENLRKQGEHLIERLGEFERVPAEMLELADAVDKDLIETALRVAGELTPEQRTALRQIENQAADRASAMSKDIALWGRDVNVFEGFLRSLGLPFASYELKRPVRFGLLAARRPSLVLDLWRYQHASDDFYVDTPGPLDFSFARAIGLGPLRTLLRPTFDPEHEGTLGVMERAGDWASKFGFFPMGLELATAATLGANGDMEGVARFLSVPPAQAVLDVAGLAGVPGAAQFQEAFPEPFREQMVRAQLIDWGINPDDATDEERDRAFKATALPSLIAAQTGAARFRPEGLKRIWKARADAAAAAGVPKDVVQKYLGNNRNPIYATGDDGLPFLNVAEQRAAQRGAAEKLGVSEDVVAASSRAWLHIKPEKQQRLVDYGLQLRRETEKLEQDFLLPKIAALDKEAITVEEFRRALSEMASQRQAIRVQVMRQAGLKEDDLARAREGLRPEDLAADDYYSVELQDFNGNGDVDDADWEEFKRRRQAILNASPQHSAYILDEYPKKLYRTPRAQELADEYRGAVRDLDAFLQLPRWRGLDGEQSRRVDEIRHFARLVTQELERRTGKPLSGRRAQVQVWRIAGQMLKEFASGQVAPYETPLLSKGLSEQDRQLFRLALQIALAGDDDRERLRDPAPTLFAIANPRIIEWYPGMTSRILGGRRLRIVASELGIEEHPGIAALLGG